MSVVECMVRPSLQWKALKWRWKEYCNGVCQWDVPLTYPHHHEVSLKITTSPVSRCCDQECICYWMVQFTCVLDSDTLLAVQQLSTVTSSSGVQWIFSYELVHSKLRNRLGTDKAAKLSLSLQAFECRHCSWLLAVYHGWRS